jgi:hypothetical protein
MIRNLLVPGFDEQNLLERLHSLLASPVALKLTDLHPAHGLPASLDDALQRRPVRIDGGSANRSTTG